jgi:hypothetical protein
MANDRMCKGRYPMMQLRKKKEKEKKRERNIKSQGTGMCISTYV